MRVGYTILLLIFVLSTPFWIYMPAILLGIILFPLYVEAIFFGLLIDTIYGGGSGINIFFRYIFGLGAAILVLFVAPLRSYLRFNV